MKQLTLQTLGHGGLRAGAGRKRKKGSGVRHRRRAEVNPKHPLHITVRMRKGAPSLRNRKALRVFCRACKGAIEHGVRVLQYAVLGNHFHILVEAEDTRSLARAMRSLNIRVARGLNAIAGKTGKVQQDRYHVEALTTPTQMKNALVYVFTNAAKHLGGRRAYDAYNSYLLFAGEIRRSGWNWRKPGLVAEAFMREAITGARSWLARTGWRRAFV